MASLKERLVHWKENRTAWQKAGDIFFWLLLVLLIIPGPRKVIATGVNRVFLHLKHPGMDKESNQLVLREQDYQWTLMQEDGETLQFKDLKGKVVFLNFWATWCPPCVAELPEIQRAYDKHGEDVVFLLITDQQAATVDAFMDKHGYRLPVTYSRSAPPEIFSHRSIPTTYILSKEGKIVSRKTGAVNWDSRATDKLFESLLR
jgi:thiol-disulfide isomerase/thioredoxin